MDPKKVIVFALHNELESVYPPLNISIGAAATGADVLLAFSRSGVNILDHHYIPIPSRGKEYLANAIHDFKASSIGDLLSIAVNLGVRFVVPDSDDPDSKIVSELPFEKVPLKWLLNEAATANLFVHF
ncbi:peroxiredoxin family protein [Paenibacillus sp. MAH-36]|uniref:Peroxiredoxin family protein n=1 Tax=Paenibacillus violae TaxID=3077234 RepID=A0ABU3RQ47_9BACL|nr:peroxiredoxin family protein [Paenibacillus sp. PFR10]MDU0206294.1 peroxiredoxin family protein [Paenibacillus sp. PFR10]